MVFKCKRSFQGMPFFPIFFELGSCRRANAFFSAAKPQAPASFRFQYFSTHRSWRKKKRRRRKKRIKGLM